MNDIQLSTPELITILLIVLWDITWKGLALWRAGRLQDTAWFVVLLVINSVGILPIAYLVTHKDIKE